MRTIIAIAAMAAAAATSAVAQPNNRLSDVEFMQAARCAGIASADSSIDTTSIKALLKAQGSGRVGFIADKADEMRSDAARSAKRANGYAKEKLNAELDGACKRYLG
ncbi:MAG: hypothetical protein ACM3W4_01830 [Ignavibacteriales bacterium]